MNVRIKCKHMVKSNVMVIIWLDIGFSKQRNIFYTGSYSQDGFSELIGHNISNLAI